MKYQPSFPSEWIKIPFNLISRITEKFPSVIFFLLIISLEGFGQKYEKAVSEYLNSIRNNPAALTAFLHKMPKGGDLHHHYSGSVYAETYFDFIEKADFYVNERTYAISKELDDKEIKSEWKKISQLKSEKSIDEIRYNLFKLWSVRDYNFLDEPSNKHFFDSFGKFGPAIGLNYRAGLIEIKERAKSENVQYIETMFRQIEFSNRLPEKFIPYNDALRKLQNEKNEKALHDTLFSLYKEIQNKKTVEAVLEFNKEIEDLHKGIDDSLFLMRFQNYVLRFYEPVDFFTRLITAFISSDLSRLVVGVNIVAPEDHDVSMQDYWLHMQMFRFCHEMFPGEKYSMHAGELTMGLVKPEDLNWHINSAVKIAKANRIGHGVDIAYEEGSSDLMDYMSVHEIPIEINLVSNEFILNVKDHEHPVSLYFQHEVPIVISTDDAGILRTDHTEQFKILALRYPEIPYEEIKTFVYNSIKYSFIEEDHIKIRLQKDLDVLFKGFEADLSHRIPEKPNLRARIKRQGQHRLQSRLDKKK